MSRAFDSTAVGSTTIARARGRSRGSSRSGAMVIILGTVALALVTGCSAGGSGAGGTTVVAPVQADAASTAPAAGTPTRPLDSAHESVVVITAPATPSATCAAPPTSGSLRPGLVECTGPSLSPPPGVTSTDGSTTATPTPTTAATGSTPSSSHAPAAGPVDPASLRIAANTYAWRTPTGNIFCQLATGSVFCQAGTHSFSYQGDNCGPTGADGAELDAGKLVKVGCYGDPPDNPVRTLGYGSTVTVGDLTCDSEAAGMKCADSDGDGFVINKSSITILPTGDHPLPLAPASSSGSAAALAAFVGTWYGHGRTLVVTPAGLVSISYRTYTWCGAGVPAPCDTMRGNEIVDGGNLTAKPAGSPSASTLHTTVTASTAADSPVGADFPLQLSAGVITTPLTTFCSSAAKPGACGA